MGSSNEQRVVPSPVLVEVDYFVPARAFELLLADVRRGAFYVEDLHPLDYERVKDLLGVYEDLDLGFVDAAVLAVVERLGERRLATLDHRHFAVMRPQHVTALELLPAA